MHGDKQCTDWADMLTFQVGSCDDSLSEVPGYSHYALCHIQPSAWVFTIITIVTLKKRTINLSEMGGKEDFRLFSNAQLAPDQLRYLQIFFMEPAWVLSSSLFSIMNSISFNICSICIKIIWQNQQFAFQFFKSFPCLKEFNLGVTVVFITLFLYFVFHDHRLLCVS